MGSNKLVEYAICEVAKKSPSFFQDIIFVIEAGLMRQLSEEFPEEAKTLQQKIARNVGLGITQCAVRVAFTGYGADDIAHLSFLIRSKVEQVFFETFHSNPKILGGAFLDHWLGEEAPEKPFIQTSTILD